METALLPFAVVACLLHSLCNAQQFEADYIVVGAGSAGSVVANRLSADPQNTVLLLEAGERPNLMAEIPNFYNYLRGTKYDWNFTAQVHSFPEYKVLARDAPLPQGKILGGTSSINGMVYARGNQYNYDKWARNGATGWNWKNVLPLFMKSENNQDPDIAKNGYHGKSGEMYVQRPTFKTSFAAKYMEAVKTLGYSVGDVNGPLPSVFMNPQLTIHNGRRWGSFKAFISGIEGRRNFRVLTSAFVRRVLFERKRAIGVEVDYKGKTVTMRAKKEVILSAGAIKSPQILMLSGVGPKKELEKFKIAVVSDRPVGKNFHDHPIVPGYTKLIMQRNISITEKDYNEFLISGGGILSDISSEVLGFINSNGSKTSRRPDIEIIFVTFVEPKSLQKLPLPITSCVAVLVSPKSRGDIKLRTVDPYDSPLIDPNYLSNEDDVKAMQHGVQVCMKFGNVTALRQDLTDIPFPLECYKYYADPVKYSRCVTFVSVAPGYHIGGSCKMGNAQDPKSVVDPQLRVIGTEGLRVIDNSIIPEMPSGHPHATAVMIGEKGAKTILDSAGMHSHSNIPIANTKT